MADDARPRILVCPQEFKGSLTAAEAAHAIAEGARAALEDRMAVRKLPIGDGGPGTVAACLEATGAQRVVTEVTGPLGAPQRVHVYALRGDHDPVSAVIESSAACGLVLVAPEDRRPGLAATRGVGELVADALERGARRIVVGVGGTGTNDGGAGAARALGLRLLDHAGAEVPEGVLGLIRLETIERTDRLRALAEVELRVAVDVTNPLLGIEGATAIYGPQKGVRDWELPAFDAALGRWAARVESDLGLALADLSGAGGGGGLPVGLLAAIRAAGGEAGIESGAALVADLVDLRRAIADADLVVTGEGSIDAQTGYGKAVAHVAALAAELDRPCIAVAGLVDGLPDGVSDAEASAPSDVSVEAAIAARRAVDARPRRLLARGPPIDRQPELALVGRAAGQQHRFVLGHPRPHPVPGVHEVVPVELLAGVLVDHVHERRSFADLARGDAPLQLADACQLDEQPVLAARVEAHRRQRADHPAAVPAESAQQHVRLGRVALGVRQLEQFLLRAPAPG